MAFTSALQNPCSAIFSPLMKASITRTGFSIRDIVFHSFRYQQRLLTVFPANKFHVTLHNVCLVIISPLAVFLYFSHSLIYLPPHTGKPLLSHITEYTGCCENTSEGEPGGSGGSGGSGGVGPPSPLPGGWITYTVVGEGQPESAKVKSKAAQAKIIVFFIVKNSFVRPRTFKSKFARSQERGIKNPAAAKRKRA